MKLVSVVIPVYKANPSPAEVASFRQCLNILHKYPVIIFTHHRLDLSSYIETANESGKNVEVNYFDEEFFESLEGYNRLLIDSRFYRRFRKSKYILIYQLDAWVFKDELEYWCEKAFDYIGAPWFADWINGNSKEFIQGGNGGFSLRKVSSCLKFLKRVERIKKAKKVLDISTNSKLIIRFRIFVYNNVLRVKNRNNVPYLLSQWYRSTEDYLWSYLIPITLRDFKLAPPEESRKFSFEVQPEYLFQLNNGNLPFGCHAWEKYGQRFWHSYIKV